MECNYTVYSDNGEVIAESNSYEELLNLISKKNLIRKNDSVDDIVYSKQFASKRQEQQVNAIIEIKEKNIEYRMAKVINDQDYSPILNSEPSIDNGMSLIDWFDTDAFSYTLEGQLARHLPKLDKERYRTIMFDKLKEEMSNATDEQIIDAIDIVMSHWGQIQEDSYAIHKIIGDPNTLFNFDNKSVETIINDIISDKDVPQALKTQQTLRNMVNGLQQVYKKTGTKGRKVYQNINLRCKIGEKDVLGHIDYLTIDPDGTASVYLYKVSVTNKRFWPKVKRAKYRFQLAFLKQMLSQNGVNTSNMRLNIIPIYIQYNDDYDIVKDISFDDIQCYSTDKNGRYIMNREEQIAREFIQGKQNLFQDDSDLVQQAEYDCDVVFPDLAIRQQGITGSIDNYIEQAVNGYSDYIFIKPSESSDHEYDLRIGNVVYKIKDKAVPKKNKEIREKIKKHIEDFDDNKGQAANNVKNAIIEIYNGKDMRTYSKYDYIFNAQLAKYFRWHEEDGDRVYDWELVEDLSECSILVFRNKKTNTFDFVSLSAMNLQAKIGTSINDNILSQLGYYNAEYTGLEGNFGNIETVRLMLFINQFVKTLKQTDDQTPRLGTMTILSPLQHGQFVSYSVAEFNKKYFKEILRLTNQKVNQSDRIQNNLNDALIEDPIEHLVDLYELITEDMSDTQWLGNFGFNDLIENKQKLPFMTQAQKLDLLINIQQMIKNQYPNIDNPSSIDANGNTLHKLYIAVSKAVNFLSGRIPQYRAHVNNIETTFVTATAQSDPNISTITSFFQTVSTSIGEDLLKFDDSIRSHFDTFRKEKGYSNVENTLVGGQASLYLNLYEIDPETGKMTMKFKNPYDNNNNLSSSERTILKYFLYQIANINSYGQFSKVYKSPDDSKLRQYVSENPQYLWVPLIHASKSSQRRNINTIINHLKNNVRRYMSMSGSVDEFILGISEEERIALGDEDSIYKLTLSNPFNRSVATYGAETSAVSVAQARHQMIEKYGPEYFEINLENLLIDFFVKKTTVDKYNKFLIAAKSFILEMNLVGSDSVALQKENKYCNDYIRQSIFQKMPMTKEEEKLIGMIAPIKSMTSHILIGGNIIGAFRDLMEGAQQNFLRSMIKYHTQLDANNVTKAYAYVSTHQNGSALAVNLLNRLCVRYRLTNIDVSSVAQRLKTDRNGIRNFETALYSTLRTPDFINRMTLFVAQCMQDGCWEAFSLDDKGNLKYDWKKDKRFKAYAMNDKSDMKAYNEAKGLYYSLIRQYNNEHPDSQIELTDDLPTPYTNAQVASLRAQADNIYGSYDHSTRAAYEGKSYGIMLGMFTTWMNGIINNYFMKAQTGILSNINHEQETDDYGNLLYIKDDGQLTTNPNEGVPIYKDNPIIVQGILSTVQSVITMCRNNGKDAVLAYIKANPHEQANLRKLLSDALMAIFLGLLYNFAITPAYKDYKKQMKDMPVLANLCTEILYKSSSRAWDQYKGPLNVVQFVGQDMSMPFYTTPVKIFTDAGKVLFGDKQWQTMLTGNVGMFRAFKDTYRYGIVPNQ